MIYQIGVHWAAKDIDPLKSVIIDDASPSVRTACAPSMIWLDGFQAGFVSPSSGWLRPCLGGTGRKIESLIGCKIGTESLFPSLCFS
jgi:hypothetical protein